MEGESLSEELKQELRINRFPAATKKYPDFAEKHRKKVYESSKWPFRALGSLADFLTRQIEYQKYLITQDTHVCCHCFNDFKSAFEEERDRMSMDYALVQSTPSDEPEPTVSQNYAEEKKFERIIK